MNTVAKFIESGILELYVLGAASEEDVLAVEKMAAAHPEVKQEIDQISQAMEHYAQTRAVKPRATVKTLVMATIDYLERMKQGELPESPPVLTPNSRISDFEKWLHHKDAVHPADAAQIHARISAIPQCHHRHCVGAGAYGAGSAPRRIRTLPDCGGHLPDACGEGDLPTGRRRLFCRSAPRTTPANGYLRLPLAKPFCSG